MAPLPASELDERAIRRLIDRGVLAPTVLPDDPYLAREFVETKLINGPQVTPALAAARTRRLRATTALLQDERRASLVAVAEWRDFLAQDAPTGYRAAAPRVAV